MDFIIEFWKFLKVRKKYWLLPIIIILVLFGGRKIPELMKGLGSGIKEFKKASSEDTSTDENKDREIKD